ncbi:MAG: transporter substrate-binding domain-containing protein [Methylibium sp.]|uniref:transporter substrate-binding domain-containing protein n=1 Tax=Methylibium sp. TaxID=2067992 RepID=UPI001818301B|nr:transporter substrate-binding domain-containing protein [Methylibium sp.]MBA3598277.1 transporter substrate-binding domain-containing protein [Methylibium sp.]
MKPSLRWRHIVPGLVLVFTLGQASATDLAEIKARGEIRHLGINYANFVTGAGDGFDVELVQGFARYIGVAYKLVPTDFYNVIRDLLGKDVVRQGDQVNLQGDFPVKGDIIATGFTVLPWRAKVLDYSAPTFPSQVLLVARADSADRPIQGSGTLAGDIAQTRAILGRKSLLVMERTCLDPANYGLKGKGIDLRAYTKSTNLNEMVPALLKGDAEFTLLDVPDVILDLQKWSGQIKVIGPISEEQQLAAAFPKTSPELRRAFDAYLVGIKADGRYDKLVDKYYPGIRRYFPAFFGGSG